MHCFTKIALTNLALNLGAIVLLFTEWAKSHPTASFVLALSCSVNFFVAIFIHFTLVHGHWSFGQSDAKAGNPPLWMGLALALELLTVPIILAGNYDQSALYVFLSHLAYLISELALIVCVKRCAGAEEYAQLQG